MGSPRRPSGALPVPSHPRQSQEGRRKTPGPKQTHGRAAGPGCRGERSGGEAPCPTGGARGRHPGRGRGREVGRTYRISSARSSWCTRAPRHTTSRRLQERAEEFPEAARPRPGPRRHHPGQPGPCASPAPPSGGALCPARPDGAPGERCRERGVPERAGGAPGKRRLKIKWREMGSQPSSGINWVKNSI